jgi:ubiquinone/menaquinone biosynthesis C-methylase UbiE
MPTSLSRPVNYWPDSACAKAFWGQHEAPAYRRLLSDTTAWLDPQPGDRWLDLGCGCGKLTQALWEKSGGTMAEVIGLDCASDNDQAFQRFRTSVRPPASEDQIRFVQSDFSPGLAAWDEGRFDGVVSGLAIQYAESYSEERGCWTTAAYDHLLAEVYRVLRPRGWFVFSVNVPEPAWAKVALRSLQGVFSVPKPGRYLRRAWRMLRYGSWLKQEARRGRFHYLPVETIVSKLAAIGFQATEHQLTYVGQAFLFRCRKPI